VSLPSRSRLIAHKALLLFAIFGGYGGLVALSDRLADDLYRYLLPNLWLMGASILWIRKIGIAASLIRGGRRTGMGLAFAVVMAALALVMTLFWPNRHATPLNHAAFWMVLLVPVAEELFFRGVLLDTLRQRLKSGRAAALLVSALFGLAHLPQGGTVAVVMFVLSLLLSALVLGTCTLTWPIVMHLGWNALAVIRELPVGRTRWIVCGTAITAMTLLSIAGMVTSGERVVKKSHVIE
jgi:membrane protease YdiL (CAAX protease family)